MYDYSGHCASKVLRGRPGLLHLARSWFSAAAFSPTTFTTTQAEKLSDGCCQEKWEEGSKRIKVDGGRRRKSVKDSATANRDEEESTKIFLCSCDGICPDLRILLVVSGKSCTAGKSLQI